jgi:microcin C transport system substrate-binding protein
MFPCSHSRVESLEPKGPQTMKRIYTSLAIAFLAIGIASPARTESGTKESPVLTYSAFAMNGEPKYVPGFSHFDYVNAKAPKGGLLRMDALDTFDSLNSFIIKGNPADGLALTYDMLTISSDDEPFSRYGLVAEKTEMPADRSWVIFHINKKARFQDGVPIKASDVVFSFHALVEKGAPLYARYYADVKEVKALDQYRIKFGFGGKINRELPLILGELPVLPEHYWKNKDFSATTLDIPMGSGPYKIEGFKPGRSITYVLNDNYWAKDLPVNVGRYNFKRIRYDYYRDETVALQAFKSGEYDFRRENSSKNWATEYQGPPFEKGLIKKEAIPNNVPQGMQCFVMNQRRELFKDRRVRQALAFAFDFEWTNKNLFYSMYSRTDSYFENSELQADRPPSAAMLKILEPFRKDLWPEVYTQSYTPPSIVGADGMRNNLRNAFELLRQSGWEVKDGVLKNKATEKPFTFEILLYEQTFERVVLPFTENLKRLGIKANVRLIDTSQYINRLRDYDFDMIVFKFSQSLSPGNEQRWFWSSEAAKTPGTRNYCGIQNKAIDQLVDLVISAGSRQELVNRCKALDQALLWGHYVIPNWHYGKFRVAYAAKVKHPDKMPPYDLSLDSWWIDPKLDQATSAKPTK